MSDDLYAGIVAELPSDAQAEVDAALRDLDARFNEIPPEMNVLVCNPIIVGLVQAIVNFHMAEDRITVKTSPYLGIGGIQAVDEAYLDKVVTEKLDELGYSG